MFKIEISNYTKEVLIHLNHLSKAERVAVRRGMLRNAQDLSKLIKKGILNPPKTGKKYPSLPNISSAAGEYPANQTGKLLNSVAFTSSLHETVIGYKAEYGRYLELGTRRRIAPRPALQTTINTNVLKLINNLEFELNKYLGKKC